MYFVIGDVVTAWEREGKERDIDFQMVDLGGSNAHFRFSRRTVMVCVRVAA